MMRYDRDRQVVDSGFVMTDELREKLGAVSFGGLDDQRPGLFETFHCDDTYTEEPAAATILVARQLPRGGGGNTSFLDMRAAYNLLAPDLKLRLAGLRSVNAYDNQGAFPPRVPARPSANPRNACFVEHAAHADTNDSVLRECMPKALLCLWIGRDEVFCAIHDLRGKMLRSLSNFDHRAPSALAPPSPNALRMKIASAARRWLD